jgi:hypothetical protein
VVDQLQPPGADDTGNADVPDAARYSALLAALVIAPGVFTRNRHFELLSSGAGSRARKQAKVLRGLVAHLARTTPAAEQVTFVTTGAQVALGYVIPSMNYTRNIRISAFEARLVRYVVARQYGAGSAENSEESSYFQQLLAQLLTGA